MRAGGWASIVIVLSACTNPRPPVAPRPATAECPASPQPTDPKTECPEKKCPECPKPPPPPAAKDWHCLDRRGPDGTVTTYCWITSSICENKRKRIAKKRLGNPSECVTQRTAYCFTVTSPSVTSWQTLCARTAENCEIRRQATRAKPAIADWNVGPCKPSLNDSELEFNTHEAAGSEMHSD